MTSRFLPKWVAWEATRRCNLACIHCRSSSGDVASEHELTTEEVFDLLRDLADFSKPVVVLSGGEPLLRADIFDIAQFGTDQGLKMCMATNGVLVDDDVCGRMKTAGIQMVSLSLDGANAHVHDAFRKQPGAFEATVRASEVLKRHAIRFLVNSSFTKRNQEEIPRVYQLAKELGAEAWYMFLVVPTGRGEDLLAELIDADDYERILEWHYEAERLEDEILMRPTCAPHYYRIWRQRSKEEGQSPKRRSLSFSTGASKGCVAGQWIALIDHVGNVQPCSYFPKSAGNIREKPFRRIWQESDLLLALRDRHTYEGRCGQCEYVGLCGGCRARADIYHGSFLGEDPMCNYVPRRRPGRG